LLITEEREKKNFEKYLYTKFHENPFGGSPVVPRGRMDGRTDRNAEANSRFSQFFERASRSTVDKKMFRNDLKRI